MRPFSERNPLLLGIVGLSLVAAVGLLAFNLSIFTGGTTYSAAFAEAGGLKSGQEVRIAGVKVGKVTGVTLDGDHVKVKFTSDEHFGTDSRAAIKIKTILGDHYLAVDNRGPGRQHASTQIPVSRTTPPYDVVPALQDASAQLKEIDTKQLAKSFDVLSQTMQGSPENVRRTLAGLQKISRAVASRDTELNQLLQHTTNVSKLLADRSGDLAALVKNGGLLLQEVDKRRQVVSQLLTGTVQLSQQITGTIQENHAALHPALTNLHRVVDILQRNQGNLEKTLSTGSVFVNEISDMTGNGPWFDNYIQNLIPLPVSIGKPSPPVKDRKGTPAPKKDGNPLPQLP